MIIEEKGLVKAIKAAYRHSGYTVLNQGGEVTIYTEGWFVRCLWTKLPRKALAIIVEHMGMIPDDGEAMAIEKDDQPQAVMAGIVSDDVAGWMGGEAASMASYVPVTFRGYQLFQEVNGRQAYGVDPTALAIVERVTAEMGTAAISGGRALAWSHDGETVMLGAIRKTTWAWEWERTVWEALESVARHKKGGWLGRCLRGSPPPLLSWGRSWGPSPAWRVHGTTPFTGSFATSARRRTATPARMRRNGTARRGGWG